MSSGKHIKGMVCVDLLTYRLERVERGYYEVIRLADEVPVGRFKVEGKVQLEPLAVDAILLRRIAREALQRGKTSWVFHESPKPPPAEPNETETVGEGSPLNPERLAPV
ncbi:MAG TPA: hypothetical protein VGK73_07840 [Polyangiaceae bacterium]